MGFGVVADEVRTLAQRCAQAARETADKISDSAAKSEQGVTISGKMAVNLSGIVERIRKLDEMIAGIAQASHEQSQGISQLNQTVAGMDKITQSNAALAQQSAASSDELKAQAEQVQNAVFDLMAMVDGQELHFASNPATGNSSSHRSSGRNGFHASGNNGQSPLVSPRLAARGQSVGSGGHHSGQSGHYSHGAQNGRGDGHGRNGDAGQNRHFVDSE